MTDAEATVLEKAHVWWLMHQPLSATHEEHLAMPRVNCSTETEINLAVAVANWLKDTP